LTRAFFITQQFDPADPNLAIVPAQVAAIARRVDEVVVVADRVVASALPANARGYSFHSRWKLVRGLRLLSAVARELRGLRDGGAVIAHMCPVYAIIVAPLVRPARVPLVMWWSHWKLDRVVRTAERVCTRVVTVGPTTFPGSSRKLVMIGQAIDVESFPVRDGRHGGPQLRAVVIGRYSPAKGVTTILQAVRLAVDHGVDLRLDVYGNTPNEEAREERRDLEQTVADLDLGARVELHGPVSRAEVIRLLGDADVLLNNAPGGADRIVYEAGASGVPVLASNPAHAGFLDSDAFFARDDPGGLATKLADVAALPPAERDAVGRRLRARVERENSVDSWATGLLAAAGIEPRAVSEPRSPAG
jgi:glycosyltransferase involved in cell wall biosynthesis